VQSCHGTPVVITFRIPYEPVKKIQADGIKLDEPIRKNDPGAALMYIADP
jgi:hypothetical protein